MSYVKLGTLEETFKSEFSIDRFIKFTREFFNKINLITPLYENDYIYAEYKYIIASYTHIGTYKDGENKTMGIFTVKIQNNRSVERARATQRNFVSKLLELASLDAALVAFYSEDDSVWRLSFVRMDYEFVAGRAKKNLTPVKRYSYLVGKGEPCHTAVEQLFPIFRDDEYNPTIDRIELAFSVQSVTNSFFKEYKEKYLDVKEYLDKSEDFMEQAKLHNFTSEQFAKKLMGQIAFLYFIQKKGWLGVKAIPSKINKKEYDNAYYKFGKSSREVIGKLFANTAEDEYSFNVNTFRDFTEYEMNIAGECFVPEPWGNGPRDFMYQMFETFDSKNRSYFNEFLQPLFYEALNKKRGGNQYYYKLNKRIPFLNGGLFQPIDNYDWKINDFSIPNDVFSNKKSKGREADGILDVFGKYNFTVNESEPFESEVAVDPEMLGKIFENLLEISDRKSKGTYYTPREIVSYMCKESLIIYLVNKTGINKDDIEDFVLYGEVMRDYDCSKEGKKSDILQIPKAAYDRLQDIDDALKNVKIADPAVGSGAFPLGMVNEIVRIRTNITYYMARELNSYEARLLHAGKRHTYQLKRDTIKNSIYAVDIDASAVDITRLRLWLSLVVDDEINPEADESTILETAKHDPHTLPNLDCNILCGNSLIDEIDGVKLFNESILYGKGEASEWQTSIMQSQYDTLLQQLFDAQDSLFSAELPELKEELKSKIRVITDKLIRININPIMVSQETVEKYENTINMDSKPYFLWKLEFGKVFKDNGGFDIVIGNPPYVQLQKNGGFLANQLKGMDYEVYDRTGDIYCIFYEMGAKILTKNGSLCFITSNKWLKSGYGKNLRKFFSNFNPKILIDLGANVFTSVSVDTNIMLLENTNNMNSLEVASIKNSISNLHVIFSKEKSPYENINENSWFIGTKTEIALKKKIEKAGLPLKKHNIKIYRGILTGLTEAFIINKETYKNIVDKDPNSVEILKPLLRGRDINKYYNSWAGLYLIKTDYDIDVPRLYPAVYEHLLKYEDKAKKRGDKGKNWWNLRPCVYYDEFEKDKIVWSDISNKPSFDWINGGVYFNNTAYMITGGSKFLLGVLNSKVVEWIFPKIATDLGENGTRYFKQFVEEIPIPLMESKKIEELVDQVLKIKKENPTEDIRHLEYKIDQLAYKIFKLSNEEIELIEKSLTVIEK